MCVDGGRGGGDKRRTARSSYYRLCLLNRRHRDRETDRRGLSPAFAYNAMTIKVSAVNVVTPRRPTHTSSFS